MLNLLLQHLLNLLLQHLALRPRLLGPHALPLAEALLRQAVALPRRGQLGRRLRLFVTGGVGGRSGGRRRLAWRLLRLRRRLPCPGSGLRRLRGRLQALEACLQAGGARRPPGVARDGRRSQQVLQHGLGIVQRGRGAAWRPPRS